MPITLAVLAGGRSRRMGTDKALIERDGFTLLARVAGAGLAASLPVLVVGRERPERWPLPEAAFIPDLQPEAGPLGGLQAALRQAGNLVLLTACDMPLLTAPALKWLADQANNAGTHGLAVLNQGRLEPLFSVYDPACLPLVEQRLAAGNLSLRGLIEAGQFARADAPDWVAAQLVNVNTPEDLAQILSA